MNVTHKTGYLYQDNFGSEKDATGPVESWHRTFAGALKAKAKNRNRGSIYLLLSDDQCRKVG